MMEADEIPFFKLPHFRQSVQLAEQLFILEFRHNGETDRWYMDISDSDEEPILTGILLKTGVPLVDSLKARVLRRLPPGDFVVFDPTGSGQQPNWENIESMRLVHVYK